MVFEPLDVPEVNEERFWDERKRLRSRLDGYVDQLLQRTDDPAVRDQVQFVAFTPTEVLPKREQRPTVEVNYLAERLYLAHDPDGKQLDAALAVSVGAMEYYDIVDDVVDGDVRDGHEIEVVVTNELLMPLFVQSLGEVGSQAVVHWADHAGQTVGSWVAELSGEPSLSAYQELVDRQSHLYGSVTGVAAIAAGAEETAVERATAVGRAYFRYEQLLLDLSQWEQGDDDPWNVWRLADAPDAREWINEERATFERLIESLPAEQQQLLAPLVATDISAFRESLE
jgi:hypothetical protein